MKNKFISLSALLMILWPTLDLSAINIEPDKNPKINVITYTATEKLAVHDAFNVEIIAHDFSNGRGTITFAGKVTTIGDHAFSSCSGLTSVTIPNSVTTIGSSAFYYCSGLTSVTIPNSVTTIGSSAFSGCSGLTSVTIPNSVTTIEGWAFGNCSGLTSVTIGNSVTTIGYRAFYKCSGLTSVTIGNSVTTIGYDAFWGCSGLTSVTINSNAICGWANNLENIFGSQVTKYIIGPSVRSIGDHAFWICSNLESIFVDPTNTHYISMDGVLFNYAKDTLIQYPIGNTRTSYTIPTSVTTIRDGAFWGCSSLTSITIGNSVTTIGYDAFYKCSGIKSVTWNAKNCNGYNFGSQVETFVFGDNVEVIPASICNGMTNLTAITIPNSVTTIGDTAFFNNTYLTDVIIGANVTEIGCNAFAGDTRIENITCYAPVTPNVCNTTFGDLDKSVIYLYVPADYQRKYQVDPNWKEFDLHLIGAEQTQTGDKVTVTPSANEATFVWPQNDQAAEYSIEITKDGVVFCTLKFNATGQLTGIAFAPGRGHTAMAHAATSTNAGWQFTVTGLNQASKYAYTLDALNASQQSIKHYQGEFATDGYTDLLPLPYEGKDGIGSVKFIHNGQLLIERNGIRYNAHGARVK